MKENKIYALLGRYMIKLSENKFELFTFLESDVMRLSTSTSCLSLCEAKELAGMYKRCLLCMRLGDVDAYSDMINLLPNHVSIHHSLPVYKYHIFIKTSLYGSRKIASKLLTTEISNINSHEHTII